MYSATHSRAARRKVSKMQQEADKTLWAVNKALKTVWYVCLPQNASKVVNTSS